MKTEQEKRLKLNRKKKDRRKLNHAVMRLNTFSETVYGIHIGGSLGAVRFKPSDSQVMDLVRAVFL